MTMEELRQAPDAGLGLDAEERERTVPVDPVVPEGTPAAPVSGGLTAPGDSVREYEDVLPETPRSDAP